MGVWGLDHTRLAETGKVVTARVVQPDDHITTISANGIVMRTPVSNISRMGRMTRGVRIVGLDENDILAAMARLSADLDPLAGIEPEVDTVLEAVVQPTEASDDRVAEILNEG